MAVYVDDYRAAFRGMQASHLLADSAEELFAMVDSIGVKRKWYQNGSSPHFDICEEKRLLALEHGAVSIKCGSEEWGIAVKAIKQRFKKEETRKLFLKLAME